MTPLPPPDSPLSLPDLIGQPSTCTYTLDHPDKPDNDTVVIARPNTATARLSPLSLPDLIGQLRTHTYTLDYPGEPDNDTVATTLLTIVIASPYQAGVAYSLPYNPTQIASSFRQRRTPRNDTQSTISVKSLRVRHPPPSLRVNEVNAAISTILHINPPTKHSHSL